MKAKFTISKEFRKYIWLRGWTVTELSKQISMSKSQISAIMNGKIEPSMNFLHKICVKSKLGVEDIIKTKFVK